MALYDDEDTGALDFIFELARKVPDALQKRQEDVVSRVDVSPTGQFLTGVGSDLLDAAVPRTSDVPLDLLMEMLLGPAGPAAAPALATLVSPTVVKRLSRGIREELANAVQRKLRTGDSWTPPEELTDELGRIVEGAPRVFHSTMQGPHAGPRYHSVEDLPQTLYHVTTGKPGVETDRMIYGLTGGEVRGASTGAGGAGFPGVSTTPDLASALHLKEEMSKLGKIHRRAADDMGFQDGIDEIARIDKRTYDPDDVQEAVDYAKAYYANMVLSDLERSSGKELPLSTIRQHMTNAYEIYLKTRGGDPTVLSGDLSEAVFEVLALDRDDLIRELADLNPAITRGTDSVGTEYRIPADIPVDPQRSRQLLREKLAGIDPAERHLRGLPRMDPNLSPYYEETMQKTWDVTEESISEAEKLFAELGMDFPASVPILDEAAEELADAATELDPFKGDIVNVIETVAAISGLTNEGASAPAKKVIQLADEGMSPSEAFRAVFGDEVAKEGRRTMVERIGHIKPTILDYVRDMVRDPETENLVRELLYLHKRDVQRQASLLGMEVADVRPLFPTLEEILDDAVFAAGDF